MSEGVRDDLVRQAEVALMHLLEDHSRMKFNIQTPTTARMSYRLDCSYTRIRRTG